VTNNKIVIWLGLGAEQHIEIIQSPSPSFTTATDTAIGLISFPVAFSLPHRGIEREAPRYSSYLIDPVGSACGSVDCGDAAVSGGLIGWSLRSFIKSSESKISRNRCAGVTAAIPTF
jgi:hypothetical protein